MSSQTVLSEMVQFDLQGTVFDAPGHNGDLEWPREVLGEHGDDVDDHRLTLLDRCSRSTRDV